MNRGKGGEWAFYVSSKEGHSTLRATGAEIRIRIVTPRPPKYIEKASPTPLRAARMQAEKRI